MKRPNHRAGKNLTSHKKPQAPAASFAAAPHKAVAPTKRSLPWQAEREAEERPPVHELVDVELEEVEDLPTLEEEVLPPAVEAV